MRRLSAVGNESIIGSKSESIVGSRTSAAERRQQIEFTVALAERYDERRLKR